jgi:diguanylate cyclase (GGDEF)-like protein
VESELTPDDLIPTHGPAPALEQALEQSQEVKAKVEGCADDLSVANSLVKRKIAEGATTLSAHKALKTGEAVESTVQACADDLHEVTEILSDGIQDLRRTEVALAHAQTALADVEAALEVSQDKEREATRRSLHDATTGLPNRVLFDDRLSQAIALAERHSWTLAVMFLDLDRFKWVNDTHGHAVGDLVLKEVAQRLLGHVRQEDTVCRNGGDEFLYLLMNPGDRANVERMAGLMLSCIAQPIVVGDIELIIKPSIGIALFPEDGTSEAQLINNADAAMYRAKSGVSGFALFNAL